MSSNTFIGPIGQDSTSINRTKEILNRALGYDYFTVKNKAANEPFKPTEEQQKAFDAAIEQSILSEELLTPEKLEKMGFQRMIKGDDKFYDVYAFCEKYTNDKGEIVTIHRFKDTTMVSYQNKEKNSDISDTKIYDGNGNFIRGQLLLPDKNNVKYYHSYHYESNEIGNNRITGYEYEPVKYIL